MGDDLLIPYDSLASVYEFLVPEALLTPEGSFAAYRQWILDLPPGARVLDCACGLGHLPVGLAQAGFDVTASDASPVMIERTARLAREHGVDVKTRVALWDELHAWTERFAAVFCIGNALTHAPDRRSALRNMAAVLDEGGRVIITSRNWELVLADPRAFSEVVERDGRRATVERSWELGADWDAPHHLDVAVSVDGGPPVSEHLVLWPFTPQTLERELADAGLEVVESTFGAHVDRYLVTASRRTR